MPLTGASERDTIQSREAGPTDPAIRGLPLLAPTDSGTELRPVRAAMLDVPGFRHGFFTRHGGVSGGIYAGLNASLASGDDRGDVEKNRRLITEDLGVSAEMLACPWQVHSARAVFIEGPISGERPKADALVTATPGLAVGVLTADCGPVLLMEPEAGIVAAAHAGWQGALAGILEATVETMEAAGARRERIRAQLGPTISQSSYEVGPEFVERFLATDPRYDRYFVESARAGHALFDLPRFILARLAAAGITAERVEACTYREEESYFSYRRSTHRGESDYGRQLSAIAWMGN